MDNPHHRDEDDLVVYIPRTNSASLPTSQTAAPDIPTRKSSAKKPFATDGYGAPNIRDWFFFSLELETALTAGVSFVEAIQLVALNSSRRAIRRSGAVILKYLKEGSNLSKALAHATEIPNLIRNLLLVGIRGGNVQEALRQVVSHYGWIMEIRGRILRAITYPAMLVILGTAVMIGRDTTIADLQGAMPAEKGIVVYTLKYSVPLLMGALIAVITAWLVYTPAVRPYFDRVILTAPMLGKIVRYYSLAVFYRVLALLINAGMPITDGWMMALQSVPNRHIAAEMQEGLRYLQDGEPLAEALRHANMVDDSGRTMAAVGEMAGDTPKMLNKYADYRAEQLRGKTNALLAFLSPIMIVLVFVGYFINVGALTLLAFLIVLARRLI